ncbi:MAG: site-2 protease family protein [Bacillota bacterium]
MFFFRLMNSGASISETIISVLAIVLAATTAIVFHEVSHGYIAMKNGDYTAKSRGRLTLNPVVHFDLIGLLMILLVGFGWAKPVPIDPRNFNNYKKGMIMVSLSGVTTNIILGGLGLLLLYLLNPVIGHYYMDTLPIVIMLKMFAYYYIIYLISINFMLAFFNMLPIYPLDGFRFLNLFLKPGNAYSEFMQKYGFFCLIGLLLLGNIFRRMGIWYLDIFGTIANLITKLIFLVI